ncbi:magnesium transporter [Allocatelliglobosispora scoriae]|uniref:Magnesium transport protein CorA n=1 Tax=Allocatelliglobosispora scoriae TaxID=643052 RepID=A0A841BFF7_9ACTN|nr:magnesium/cobalt transporter CorA [Allocatelliglobosispora scoriae]MBB5867024.1 magnesium transporter [Allocatelliglobosispora scoriae]
MSSQWLVGCAVYVDGQRLEQPVTYLDALDVATEHDGFVWLGIRDPTADEFSLVADRYGLHELAVEQAVTTRHRPKIERFGDVTFFVLRTTRYVEHAQLTETSEVVETGEVLIFLGERFVITVRHGEPGDLATVRSDLEKRPDLLAWGPWSVAHAVCDRLVDSYLVVAQEFETDLDELEERVFGNAPASRAAQIYQLKRELMEFKRAVAPLQRPMAAIIEDRALLPKEVRKYFGDVNDHLLRTVERITAYDELLNSILQARLAQVSVDQNNDMRKIAAWAAIAAAQTAIAGVYGMNFDFMPELHWRYGYAGVMALMALVAVGLYRAFRRSGWL